MAAKACKRLISKVLSTLSDETVIHNSLAVLRPALTLYFLFTLSHRLAFRFNVEFTHDFWWFLLLDYLVDLFFWVECAYVIYCIKFGNAKIRPDLFQVSGIEMLKVDLDFNKKKGLDQRRDTSEIKSRYVVPENNNYNDTSEESRDTIINKPRETQLVKTFSGVDKHAQFNAFEDLLSNFERKCKENEILESIRSRTLRRNRFLDIAHKVMIFVMMFPFEVVAYFVGYKFYYLLRVFRLFRLIEIPQYFGAITSILEGTNLMKGASARRVLYLTIFMVVFAHVGACYFYAMGLNLLERGDPVTDNWLTYDGIVDFHNDGTYYFTKNLRYRYVRAIYWATVTSQTVGFGDVRPRSIQETSFCFFFFYCSHILAQLAIGNLILLVNVYDTARTKYTLQLKQLEKYSKFRNLPSQLKDRISAFYYHQWKVLNGLDEAQFLSELPKNIETKVKHATVRNCLKSIDLLKGLKISLLNALAEDAKVIMYAPNDVIVAAGSQSAGVHVMSRGEAFVHASRVFESTTGIVEEEDFSGEACESGDYSNEQNEGMDDIVITQSLKQGDVFGARALTERYEYHVSLISGAGVCEIIFLGRSRFRRTCRLHLNDEEFHKLVPTNPARRGTNIGSKNKKKYKMSRKNHAHIRHSTSLNIESESISKMGLILKPDGPIRTVWDVVIFLGIVFYSITIPYTLSNSFTKNVFQRHFELFVIAFIVDLLFVLNLLFEMFLFPVFKNSVLLSSHEHIFRLFKERQNILLELICIFPWDLFALINPNYLPALRLAKIYHLRKFASYMFKTEKAMTIYLNFTFSFAVSRFIKLYVALFELCHWVACLWLLVADFSTRYMNYDISWKIQDRDSEFLSIDYHSDLNGFTAYRRAIYWAINSMATSGVADMPSTNISEMLFCCLTLLCGCQTINALLGSIASMMANINTGKRDFAAKMVVVNKYIKYKRLPKDLERRIQFFYEYSFMRTSGANEMQVLAGLPQPLREDVVKYVAGSVLVKIPFFTDCIEPMLEMILGLLSQRLFLTGDDVVIAGEHGKEFFIIESGTILVTSPDRKTVYASLGNGDYIGESCLLKVAKRTASAHARDYSDTYVLLKEDFEKVVDAFPADSNIVIDMINDILDAKARKNAELARRNSSSNKIENFKRADSEEGNNLMMSIPESEKEEKEDTEQKTTTKQVVKKSKDNWYIKFREEGSYSRRCWESILLLILIYNLIMIPLRISIENGDLNPYVYIIDYFFDVILLVDMVLKAKYVRRVVHGHKVTHPKQIWANYKKYELPYDLLARMPYDLIALAFIGNSTNPPIFVLSFLRIPKIFLMIKGFDYASAAESILEEAKFSFFALRMFQVLLYCLLVGHWLGCGLYVFSKSHLGEYCVDGTDPSYLGPCEYRDTWVQFQIFTEKLPLGAGTSLSRYLRTVNWAIPTMVLYVVGDVYPMNANETSYVFGAMFFGIAINAMIIGTIIALVTSVDDQSADILMKSDTMREHLNSYNVSPELIEKVSEYIKFLLSETGRILATENEIYNELPYSLQVRLSLHVKLHFFKECPFFDFLTDEVLRNLCMAMYQQTYYTGDYIISFGDLGQEMYFLDSGSCEVVSSDKKTIFAKLSKGAFFGETGLVFKSRRTANIRASSLCVCYILNKDQLDRELTDCDFDAVSTVKTLTKLQESNAKRNEALSRNMKLAKDPTSKLGKLLGSVEKATQESYWDDFFSPTGKFKFMVDIVGYLLMLYCAIVIPFEIAFLFEDLSEYVPLLVCDGLVELLCICELLLRFFVFPRGFKDVKSFEIKTTKLYVSFFDTVFDVIAAIPIELFALLPGFPMGRFFSLRIIHLLRLTGLFIRTEQIEKHLIRLGLTLRFTTIAVIKAIAAFSLVNHWMACMYFSVHRYIEYDVYNTWVVFDGYATFDEESGRHDICNKSILECYQRAMYFCGTVITSVGYGDIAPITDIEMVFQVFLAVVSASAGANVCGQMSSYLKLSDQSGEMAFKEKLRSVEHYCEYRNLTPELRIAIIANYRTMWRKERRVGDKSTSFLHSLSTEMAGEVALELNKSILDVVSVFKSCRSSLHRRFAYALKPQILLPDTSIYSEMDGGSCIFFILIGKVTVTPGRDADSLDEVSKASLAILERKHKYLKHTHCTGHHFGEYAMTSKSGLRVDNAHAVELTEAYSLDKEDLWHIFQRMPFQERYHFLLSLYTDVGGFSYITGVMPSMHLHSQFVGCSMKNLYRLVLVVLEDILEVLQGDSEDSKPVPSISNHRSRNLSILSAKSDSSEEEEEEISTVASKWTQALQAYDKTRMRTQSMKLLEGDGVGRKINNRSSVLVPSPVAPVERTDSRSQREIFFDSVEKRITALFNYIDRDHSGRIDRNELMLSLLDLGIEKTWEDIDAMIKFADVDGDNEVDNEELVQAIMRAIREEAGEGDDMIIEESSESDDSDHSVDPAVTKPSLMISKSNEVQEFQEKPLQSSQRSTESPIDRTLEESKQELNRDVTHGSIDASNVEKVPDDFGDSDEGEEIQLDVPILSAPVSGKTKLEPISLHRREDDDAGAQPSASNSGKN